MDGFRYFAKPIGGFSGFLREVHRQAKPPGQYPDTLYVICVLVGQHQGAEILGTQATGLQSSFDFSSGQAGINEDGGAAVGYVDRVSFAAAGQHAYCQAGILEGVPREVPDLPGTGGPDRDAASRAIVDCVQGACGAPLGEALEVQARHSAHFMAGSACRKGEVGAQYTKTMVV